MIPTKKQWRGWSLPSKLTAVGAYVGIIALVISVLFLLINNIKLRGESLLVSISDYVQDVPIDIREGYSNYLPWSITFTFPVTMINDGLKPIEVFDYELQPYNCNYTYTFRNQDGDQGLFPDPQSNKPVILPVSIPPGEGKTLFLKTAVVVSFEAAFMAFELGDESSLSDLILNVVVHGGESRTRSEDLFGNPVYYGIGSRGLVDWDPVTPESIIQPVYKLTLITARDNKYETLFAPYPVESTKSWSQDCTMYPPYSKEEIFQLPEGFLDGPQSR